MSKEEFEEKFDEMMQELELLPGESIDICYMLGKNQEIGVRCEVWTNYRNNL
jgi:hypothetical protein